MFKPILNNGKLKIKDGNNGITKKRRIQVENQCLVKSKTIKDMIYLFNIWDKVIVVYDIKTQLIISVDQHAAHERIRYEYFLAELDKILGYLDKSIKPKPSSQIDPIAVNLSKKNQNQLIQEIFYVEIKQSKIEDINEQEKQIFQKNKPYLEQVWKFELARDDVANLIKYPVIFTEQINKKEHLLQIVEYKDIGIKVPPIIDKIIMSKSCKSAIKFGEKLSEYQAKLILKNLSNCEFPFHCVHGRKSIQPIWNVKEDQVYEI